MGRDPKGKCRGCGESIIWCETESGRRMPVDERTVAADGAAVQFVIEWNHVDGRPRLVPLARFAPVYERMTGEKKGLHLSHFATCSDPAKFRKKK